MLLKKRGLSAVVGSILLVLMVIVAIAIMWALVSPSVKNGISSSSACADADISINSISGYTCLDSSNSVAMVQVKRGAAPTNINSLKFYLTSGGSSVSFQKDFVLEKNSEQIFYLNSSGLAEIEQLKVVPVILNGKAESDCNAVYVNNLNPCDLTSSLVNAEILLQGVRTYGDGNTSATAPTVYLASPVNSAELNSSSNFTFWVDQNVTSCKIYIDNTLNTTISSVTINTNITRNITGLNSGSHTWYVRCAYTGGNKNSAERSFTVPCDYQVTCGSTLSVANKYYCLAGSVSNYSSGSCFDITASNVTLDGRGYFIDGTDVASSSGVMSSQVNNTTVKNFGNISDFNSGVQYFGVLKGSIYNNSLSSNVQDGIMIYSRSANNSIYNNLVYSSGRGGISPYYSGYLDVVNNFTNNTLVGNLYGVYIPSGSPGSSFYGGNISGSSSYDVYCEDASVNYNYSLSFTTQSGCSSWL